MEQKDEHLDQVLAQLKQVEPLAKSAELAWFMRMEEHAEDARAALRWALQEGQSEKGLELAVLMARYWWVLGCRSEGRACLEAFLIQAPGARPDLLDQAQRWMLELAGEDDPI